ncbi:hypothetical protein [Bdellovibrio sp. HCB209]|uniref:hypothetical protein n=1 Tax=Bdellovibrio sp. HCB209 TaxID=3394354 RepID=UPI0039B387D5
MRQLTIFSLAMIMSLTACRQGVGEKAPPLKSAELTQSNPAGDSASKDNRGFTANTPENQKLKEQYPLEYSCTMDLCAEDFKKYPSIPKLVEAAAKPTAEQQQYYATYILPALEKNAQLQQEKARNSLEVLIANENKFPTQKLEPDQLVVLHAMYFIKNSEKFPLFKAYFDNILPLEPFYKASVAYRQMGNWTYFSEMHPNLSLLNAAKRELQELMLKLNQLNAIIAGAVTVDPLIISKLDNNILITTEEAKALSDLAFSVRLMHHFTHGQGHDIIIKLLEQYKLSQADLYSMYVKSDLKTSLAIKSKKTISNSCEARYFQSINLYPQAVELENFKKIAESTRQASLETVGANDAVYQKIQELKFNYPLTAEENSKAWLRSLEMKNKDLKQQIQEIGTLPDNSLYAMFLIHAMFNTKDGNTTDDQCPRIPDADISDKTNTYSGHVLVSWYSVRYPEMGAGILAHEIGHNVKDYSNATSMTSTNQCLERKQGSEKYLSEDFADVFAAKVMVVLKNKYQIQTGNYGCGLMDKLQPLYNLNDKDIHSSDLYRALQLRIESGQAAPASCQNLANRDGRAVTHSCQ